MDKASFAAVIAAVHKGISREEIELRERIENLSGAIRSGDVDAFMSFLAPDVVVYDVMPPLEFIEKEDYRKAWKQGFADVFRFPVDLELLHPEIAVSGDLAVCHYLCRVAGRLKDTDDEVDNWLRGTLCFRKADDHWVVTHIHLSVPMGEDGQALLDLKPEIPSMIH
jgi:ketosteroid isomerase-like protein